MQRENIDIEELIRQGNMVQIKPRGYSMYPLLIPGRDEVLIEQMDPTDGKRGDVLLYRRDSGILVLHRVYRHTKEGYFMVGDNQAEIEGPLREDQIKGKMIALIRKGKRIPVNHPVYVAISRMWLRMRPFRPVISKIAHRIKVFFGRAKID